MTGRSREIVHMLARRRVDVCCVQETRWKGNGTRHIGANEELYKFYWCGEKLACNGVGMLIRGHLAENVIDVTRLNSRIIRVRLRIENELFTIFSVYAPQTGRSDQEKDEFWSQLSDSVRKVPTGDIVILGGDLNGHVGISPNGFDQVHGGHGYGERNDDGTRILEFAESHELCLLNTCFRKRVEHQMTFKSGSATSQIDFFLAPQALRKRFPDAKTIPGEACIAQHRLLVTDMLMQSRNGRPLRNTKIPKIKVWKLRDPQKKQWFQQQVSDRLSQETGLTWSSYKSILLDTAIEVCGRTNTKPHRDRETWWWNEAVQDAIRQKSVAYRQWQKSGHHDDKLVYRQANLASKRAVARARAAQCHDWITSLKSENLKALFRIAKRSARSRKDVTGASCIRDKNGGILLTDEDIKRRWASYFKELLNASNPHSASFVSEAFEGPITDVTRTELVAALDSMKSSKACGPSGLSSDLIKASGDAGIDNFLYICKKFWKTGLMPPEWAVSTTVPLYKGKGDPLLCGSYRGIRLLEHAMKVVEKILERRLREYVMIDNYQYGFMPGRSTIDAIFIMRQLQEKHLEKRRKLFHLFIDLEKAFDRMPRQYIRWALRRQCVPEHLICLVMATYADAKTAVRSSVGTGQSFHIGIGVHQGSILSPLLFIVVMEEITKSLRSGPPWELLYADDIVLTAESESELFQKFKAWKTGLAEHGLKVNDTKTKLLVSGGAKKVVVSGRWPCSVCKSGVGQNSIQCQQCEQWCHKRCSNIKGALTAVSFFVCPTCAGHYANTADNDRSYLSAEHGIDVVSNFSYLGDTLDSMGTAEAAVRMRIRSAWAKWKALAGVLTQRSIPLPLRSQLYRATIRPVLLYGAETWPMTQSLQQQLTRTDMKMVRWMQRITLADRVSSEEVLRKAHLVSVGDALRQHRLRWYGHVQRSQNTVVQNIVRLEVPGVRPKGRPKKSWRQTLDEDLRLTGLQREDALNRPS
jgi:hypothetical protein